MKTLPPFESVGKKFRAAAVGALALLGLAVAHADPLNANLAGYKAPPGKIEKVELLGHAGALAFTQDAAGLHVKFPAEKPCEYAYALRITGLKLK